MKANDPAFSRTGFQAVNDGGETYGHQPQEGMTLRTYIATAALQGLLAAGADDLQILSAEAVVAADFLIAELNKQENKS